jgi:hypothetical protein
VPLGVRLGVKRESALERNLRLVIDEIKSSGAKTLRDIAAELTRRGESTSTKLSQYCRSLDFMARGFDLA